MSLVEGRPGDLFTSFTELGHFFSVYFVSSESMITKFFESFDNLMILKQFMRPNNLPIYGRSANIGRLFIFNESLDFSYDRPALAGLIVDKTQKLI